MLDGAHLAVNHHVVLEWCWSVVGILHVDLLLLNSAHPCGKLEIVWDRGRKHDNTHSVRKFDDNFLPN